MRFDESKDAGLEAQNAINCNCANSPARGARKFTVELTVANYCGVLNRITGLYAKRGYNIESLHVYETEDAKLSRMMITSSGDEYVQNQVARQLAKLYDVKNVILMTQT